MRCPLCGIEMAVGSRSIKPDGTVELRFLCRNKQGENYSQYPKDGNFAASITVKGGEVIGTEDQQ